jgi:hypothetical protein
VLVAGVDHELAAGRHRVARVQGQVQDHLLELGPVGPQIAGARVQIHLEFDLLADEAPQHGLDAGRDIVHGQNLRLEHLAAAEGQKLLSQAGGPLGGVADAGHVLGQVGPGRLVEGEVREADDRGQDVVEVVGDAAGEAADRLELAGLEQLGLQAVQLARVLHQRDCAQDPAALVRDRGEVGPDVDRAAVLGVARQLLLDDGCAGENARHEGLALGRLVGRDDGERWPMTSAAV